jgi:GNAT superfamily N-acetyltransferase
MRSDGSDVLSDAERRIAQRLIDDINEFNLKSTGTAEFREMLTIEDRRRRRAARRRLTAGAGGGIEALWVGEDMRSQGVGSRLLAAAEKEARRHGCTQLALDTHTFQAPSFDERHGLEVVGELTDHPRRHSSLVLRKQLPG